MDRCVLFFVVQNNKFVCAWHRIIVYFHVQFSFLYEKWVYQNIMVTMTKFILKIKTSFEAYKRCIYIHIFCDLRGKLLVACLVTPALWLNLSDSRNILIIHFRLLLKERTLDSIGHDLWKKNIT